MRLSYLAPPNFPDGRQNVIVIVLSTSLSSFRGISKLLIILFKRHNRAVSVKVSVILLKLVIQNGDKVT